MNARKPRTMKLSITLILARRIRVSVNMFEANLHVKMKILRLKKTAMVSIIMVSITTKLITCMNRRIK